MANRTRKPSDKILRGWPTLLTIYSSYKTTVTKNLQDLTNTYSTLFLWTVCTLFVTILGNLLPERKWQTRRNICSRNFEKSARGFNFSTSLKISCRLYKLTEVRYLSDLHIPRTLHNHKIFPQLHLATHSL
jgi:hypothetical protein